MGYLRWICAIIILLLTWIRRSSNRGVGQAQTSHYQQTRAKVRPVIQPVPDMIISCTPDSALQRDQWTRAIQNQFGSLTRQDFEGFRW